MTQAERDAAYNNGAAVANSAELNAQRRAASAAHRAAHPGRLDIPYGEKPRQKWDFYPATDAPAPCLVFIHGGYWQMNGREDFAVLAAGVAAHGWSVAMPGYTLAPEASLRDIVDEIFAALNWLQANRATAGIFGNIILSGWSAGAHLAALAMAHPSVSAVLLISGVYELGPIKETYLNAKLNLTGEAIASLSPLRLPVVEKPAVIAYGKEELRALVDDSERLHAARVAAGAKSILVPVEGENHFTILHELSSPSGALTTQLLQLV